MPRSRATWGLALAVLGAVLLAAVAGLAVTGPWSSAAVGAAASEPPAGVVVSTTPLGDNEVVITLVDTARQRLSVYVADAKRSRLKLLAVRDIAADWALTDYNNDPPLPKDVRTRVEKWMETGGPGKEGG